MAKTKAEYIREFLTKDPELSFDDVMKLVEKKGWDKMSTSEYSQAKKKLGLTKARQEKPITCDELDLAKDYMASLGVDIQEAVQTIQLTDGFIDKIGSFSKGIRALDKLESYLPSKGARPQVPRPG